MYSRRSRLHRVAVGGLAMALLACASASEPTALAPNDAPADFTAIAPRHPQGVLSGKVTSFTGRPFGIDVSPKGGLVLATEQDANAVAGFYITKPAQPITPIPVTADPGDVIFNAKGTTAYASTFYGSMVHVIDGATGTVTNTIPMGSNAYRLAVSTDDSRLYVTSVYGDVRLVKLTTAGFPITSINLGASIQGITLSPDGTKLYVSSTSGSIWRLDPLTLAIQATGFVGGTPQELVISQDGAELYVANEQGAGIVVNAATLSATGSFPAYYCFGMALTPDGQQLYAGCGGALTIIDRAARTVVNTLFLGGTPRRIAFDEKGFTAVVANEGNWVDVIK